MEVGWGGEGGMVGNIRLLASHLSNPTGPKKIFCPEKLHFPGLLTISEKPFAVCS